MLIDLSPYCISVVGIESLAQEFNAHALFPTNTDHDTADIKFDPEGTGLSLSALENRFLEALQSFRIPKK